MSNFKIASASCSAFPASAAIAKLCIVFLPVQMWLVPYRVQLSLVCMHTGHFFLIFLSSSSCPCMWDSSHVVSKISYFYFFCCGLTTFKVTPSWPFSVRVLSLALHSCTSNALSFFGERGVGSLRQLLDLCTSRMNVSCRLQSTRSLGRPFVEKK